MNKLSLDALKQRAEAVASEDLLATISGGTENACHDAPNIRDIPSTPLPPVVNIPTPAPPPNDSGTIRIRF